MGRLLVPLRRRTVLVALLASGLLQACGEDQRAPDWAWLEPSTWEGQALAETELARWVPRGLEHLPVPARVILYRGGCELCGRHFDALREVPQEGALTLVRVPEPGDEDLASDARSRAPEHEHVELLPLAKGYGVETPTVLLVDATGRITAVRNGS